MKIRNVKWRICFVIAGIVLVFLLLWKLNSKEKCLFAVDDFKLEMSDRQYNGLVQYIDAIEKNKPIDILVEAGSKNRHVNMSIWEFLKWLDRDYDTKDEKFKSHIESVASCDMNSDGINETVLKIYNFFCGYLILEKDGDKIRACYKEYRGFTPLCENGIFCESGGALDNTWRQMNPTDSNFTSKILCESVSNLNEITYYISGKAVSSEKYFKYQNELRKNEVKFYAVKNN